MPPMTKPSSSAKGDTMNLWANLLYFVARIQIINQWNACQSEESDKTDSEQQQKLDSLREQFLSIPLNELYYKCPEKYAQLMVLKEAVTDEVIEDVWTNPHNELIENIDTMYQLINQNAQTFAQNPIDIIDKPNGIFAILRSLAHCDAFIHASVADKALLLVLQFGYLEFEAFRTILKVFFGLNDIQLLGILWGNKNNGGLLRIVNAKDSLFGIVEPVYSTGYMKYGDRTGYDDFLLYFYPYIPQDCNWGHTHGFYHNYLRLIDGKSTLNTPEISFLTGYMIFISSTLADNELTNNIIKTTLYNIDLTSYSVDLTSTEFVDHIFKFLQANEFESLKANTNNIPANKQTALMQAIEISGVPITIEELMTIGQSLDLSEAEVMSVIIQHIGDLMICQDGEAVRLKRVSEYNQSKFIDREWMEKDATEERYSRRRRLNNNRIQDAMQSFREQYEGHTFMNLAEKVYAFLKLYDAEIRLADLMKACLQLGFTDSAKSISRVLKSYPYKFFSCESVGKRGIWCCRETAIRQGYNVD